MENKCPICGKDLVEKFKSVGPFGTEQYCYKCPDDHYYEEFFHGSTDIQIMDFTTGYYYKDSKEHVSRIREAIQCLSKAYKHTAIGGGE